MRREEVLRMSAEEMDIQDLLMALSRVLEAFDIFNECDCGGSDMCCICSAFTVMKRVNERRESNV